MRSPAVEEWDTWPFAGPVTPRALDRPVEREPARHGEGGIDCRRCARRDEGVLWREGNWAVSHPPRPSGLPVVVLLETTAHHDFHELPESLAHELGPMLLRVERAVLAVGEIGRVHVCRFGEGSEHFHMWFLARPAGLLQLRSSFAELWDEVLPPTPEATWRENLELVQRALGAT